jgi:hypothetical protein
MQIENRCAPWIFANGAEYLVCRRCNLIRWVSAANSQAGLADVITVLFNALWRVSLILALKRSLFK